MGKTSVLFKEVEDRKGTFHARMGTINDRNGKEQTEAEKTKKWWQEYMEKNYTRKVFMTKITTMV